MQLRPLILAVALLSSASSAQMHSAAQQKTAKNSIRVVEVAVLGSKRFQAAELASSSGLRVGEDGTAERLGAAAQVLASSGMFTEVTYSWVSTPQGLRVEYKVQDIAELLPVEFDNFVWMTREDLLHKLRERRPLFRGEVPNAGEMYAQLGEDMQAILAEIHVNATVKSRPIVSPDQMNIIGFRYTVEGVRIPIRAVEFPGASPEMAAVLKETFAPRIGADFSQDFLRAFARLDLLPQFKSRGYLQARIEAAEFTPANPADNEVAVRLPVQQGLCYQLKNVQWSGNTAFPAQELMKLVKGKSGSTANAVELDEELGAISKVYGTRGYMSARLKALPTFDDKEKTVSFLIEVSEGEQYHMGNVRVEGGDEFLAKKVAERWELHSGDVFDSGYAQPFITRLSQEIDLHTFRISIGQSLNQENKTVDVALRFHAQ